jgi:hypothetical protein
MAIKIIKEGKRKIAVFKETCSLCGCVFEYNFEDVVSSSIAAKDTVMFTINCPNCNKLIQTYKTNPDRYDVVD